MKTVSQIALAATFAVGLNAVLAAAPATAAKKETAPAGPTISPAVRNAVVAAQTALAATPKDLTAAETAVVQLEAAAQSDYERFLASSLRLSLENARSSGRSEIERANLLNPLLEKIISNPGTPKEEIGIRLNDHGNLSINAKKYAEAVQYYVRARDSGYTDADLQLNIVRAKFGADDIRGGVAEFAVAIKAEQAAGRKVPENWYRLSIANLQKINATPEIDEWTRMWLTAYGTPANWREAITVFGLSGPNAAKFSRQRLDLYRLLYATKSLAGKKEYLDYADVALNIVGLPEEAITVIREGLASGAIAPHDSDAAKLKASATSRLVGNATAQVKEQRALSGTDPDLARQAGDAYFATRNFNKSAEMYQLADTKGYADKDRNNLHIGMALALAGDRERAKAAFAKVSADPYLPIARLWTTYVIATPAAGPPAA